MSDSNLQNGYRNLTNVGQLRKMARPVLMQMDLWLHF